MTFVLSIDRMTAFWVRRHRFSQSLFFALAAVTSLVAGASQLSPPVQAAEEGGPAAATPAGESGQTGLSPQSGDGTVRGQYGDWQVVCKPPPVGSKKEVCALVQSVTAEDRNNVGLTIYFQKFSNGMQVLRVFAPLGILLPPGIGLKVDGTDIGHAPFLRCHTFACYAQVTVEENLVNQFQNGKTAIFIIFQTEEAGIGIPISLNGFKEGLASLN